MMEPSELSGSPAWPMAEELVQNLRTLLRSNKASPAQAYGYVIFAAPVALGYVPPGQVEEEGDDPEYVFAYRVVTPGGEVVTLTRAMVEQLPTTLSRVLGGTVLLDLSVGLATCSSDRNGPVSHLEVMYILHPSPMLGSKFRSMVCHSLLAREGSEPLYVTCTRRPEGWPA